MLARVRLLGFLTDLGREFKRRQMDVHLQSLRLYYLAVKNGFAKNSNHRVELHWSEELTITWMRTLRIAPFERDFPVRARGGGCLRCKSKETSHSSLFTDVSFPGGSRMRCERCGGIWIELDQRPS